MRTEINRFGSTKLWFWLMQGICFSFTGIFVGDATLALGYLAGLALLNILVLSLWSRLQNTEKHLRGVKAAIILSPAICLVVTAAAMAGYYAYYH